MSILTAAPDGAKVLDLDAARAARAEARAAAGEGLQLIKVSAGYVQVRPEIDLMCAEDFTAGRFTEALSKLLVDPADVQPLLEGGLTKDDLEAITRFITGASLGESLASSVS